MIEEWPSLNTQRVTEAPPLPTPCQGVNPQMWILRKLRSLGPYLAVALFVPGGSIVALLFWTYRYRTAARPTAGRPARQNAQLRRGGIRR